VESALFTVTENVVFRL